MSKKTILGLLVASAGSSLVIPANAQIPTAAAQTPPPASQPVAPPDVPVAVSTAPVEASAPPPPVTELAPSAPVDPAAPVAEPSVAPDSTAAEAPVAVDAVPPAEPAATDTSAQSAEEAAALALLMGDGSQADVPQDEYNLGFYGFADFSVQRYVFKSFDGYPPSFSVGRLNLYFGGELGDNWRTLTEVRFSYLPNGSLPAGANAFAGEAPTNTTVPDYVDYDRPRRWGSVLIERAYVEKTIDTWLSIQVGHYLTPYGIWNVDHGSPVILGVTRPYAVGEALFPESQTGFMVHGTEAIGAANVGYVLTLSNGRGPFDTTKDLDKNKALGWRLRGNYDTDAGLFSLGYSGYRGDYTEGVQTWTMNPDGAFEASIVKDVSYAELGTAFDFRWELGGASVQSEFIMQQVKQKNGQVRYQEASPFAPAGLLPDYRRIGVYGIAAYRFDSLLGLTPWVGTEYYDTGKQPGSFFPEGVHELYIGLNLRPTPRVVLKTQYVGVFMKDTDRMDILNGQIAWSF